MDRRTNLPSESCYVTFDEKSDAEKAVEYMDQAQLDGLEIKVQFTLRLPRQGSPVRRGGGGRGRGKWRRSPPPLRNMPRRDERTSPKRARLETGDRL